MGVLAEIPQQRELDTRNVTRACAEPQQRTLEAVIHRRETTKREMRTVAVQAGVPGIGVERVEDVAVQNVKGRLITLKYKGGEVKVMVPPDVPVVNRVVTERSALRTGAVVSVQGSHSSDGGLAATQITIRATQK